jgi:alcohol dehydrogenase
MRTRAAVLYEAQKPEPYAQTRPLVIEEIEVEKPGPGEVLVELVGAGLCHSDLSVINGAIRGRFPIILGHEASGIVREVGAGVKEVQVDDHVVFSFVPTCGHCRLCAIGKPALCVHGNRANGAGTLLNGGVRFQKTSDQPISHFLGVSAFSQYTVAAEESVIKIDRNIPLAKAALFGCAIQTGVGAVINTAHVKAGEPVAVFGLGGVGLSAVMGAKLVGASPIIAVDLLPNKFELARKLGADFTVNAREGDPVAAVRDLTGGGVEYAFEAVGNANVLAQAYSATRVGGKTIGIGVPAATQQLSLPAITLVVMEKTLLGSFMGSSIPRRDIPRLIDLYMAGKLPIDELLSPAVELEDINTGFDRLAQGSAVRQLLHFGHA